MIGPGSLSQALQGARRLPTLEDFSGNLISAPNDLSDSGLWIRGNSGDGGAVDPVVTANAARAPDGTMTASRVIFNRGTGTFTRIQIGVLTGDVSRTASAYMRTYTSGYGPSLRLDGTDGAAPWLTRTWRRVTLTSTASGGVMNVQLILFSSIVNSPQLVIVDLWGLRLV